VRSRIWTSFRFTKQTEEYVLPVERSLRRDVGESSGDKSMKRFNTLVVALVFAFSVGPAAAQNALIDRLHAVAMSVPFEANSAQTDTFRIYQAQTRAQQQCIATQCEQPEVCLRRMRDRAYEQSRDGRRPSDMSLLQTCMLQIELCAMRTCNFGGDELFNMQPPPA